MKASTRKIWIALPLCATVGVFAPSHWHLGIWLFAAYIVLFWNEQ